jgi:hypothetical protein
MHRDILNLPRTALRSAGCALRCNCAGPCVDIVARRCAAASGDRIDDVIGDLLDDIGVLRHAPHIDALGSLMRSMHWGIDRRGAVVGLACAKSAADKQIVAPHFDPQLKRRTGCRSPQHATALRRIEHAEMAGAGQHWGAGVDIE